MVPGSKVCGEEEAQGFREACRLGCPSFFLTLERGMTGAGTMGLSRHAGESSLQPPTGRAAREDDGVKLLVWAQVGPLPFALL